jgi:aquaporin Z
MGFVVARRLALGEAVGYWIAQLLGGIAGAAVLWGLLEGSSTYTKSVGLGTDGYDKHSMIGLKVGGALGAEVVLTFLFVFVVLAVTDRAATPGFAGLAIGLALTVVHLVGIPLTGTSVNPARSLGPALIVAGDAIRQVWVFLVAPLVGGILAALCYSFLYGPPSEATVVVEAVLIEEVGDN